MKTYLVPFNCVCCCPQAKKMHSKHDGTVKPGPLTTSSYNRTDALLMPLSPCPSLQIMFVPWNKRSQHLEKYRSRLSKFLNPFQQLCFSFLLMCCILQWFLAAATFLKTAISWQLPLQICSSIFRLNMK